MGNLGLQLLCQVLPRSTLEINARDDLKSRALWRGTWQVQIFLWDRTVDDGSDTLERSGLGVAGEELIDDGPAEEARGAEDDGAIFGCHCLLDISSFAARVHVQNLIFKLDRRHGLFKVVTDKLLIISLAEKMVRRAQVGIARKC